MIRFMLRMLLFLPVLGLLQADQASAQAQCGPIVSTTDIAITCGQDGILKDVAGNATWQCQPDRGSIVTLAQLQIQDCSPGQTICWSGTEWQCCALRVPGDYDGDGDLDILDVTLARRDLADLPAQ